MYAICGREVALNFPRFWSDFAVTGAESTDATLLRSKQVPLDVQLHPTRALQEPMQRVLTHLRRIHSPMMSTKGLKSHNHVLGNSAPLLRSLICNVARSAYLGDSDSDISDEGSSDGAAADTPFDHGDMPALHVLHRSDSNRPWSSPRLEPTLAKLLWEESYDNDAALTCRTSSACLC